MSRGEIKIDAEKFKHNESYRRYVQNYFKDDLVQPFTKGDKKNPEFIKRYGEHFYKKSEIPRSAEVPPTLKKKGVIMGHSKWSKFY